MIKRLSKIHYREGCEPDRVAMLPVTESAFLELTPDDVAEVLAILVRERDAARAENRLLRLQLNAR